MRVWAARVHKKARSYLNRIWSCFGVTAEYPAILKLYLHNSGYVATQLPRNAAKGHSFEVAGYSAIKPRAFIASTHTDA